MEAFHTNTRNHSWLARGRGAKPWDHTRPTYPELPPQCVRHAPETTNTLWKKTLKRTQMSHLLLTYSERRLKTHTHSSYLSRKSKIQRYHNVAHLLVRRKPYIRDASQTGNTRKDNSNTHQQPHQLQKYKSNVRAEFLLLVHGNKSEYT